MLGVRESRKGNFWPPPFHKMLGHFEHKFFLDLLMRDSFMYGGKTDTFLNPFGSSDGVNLKILYRYFVTKNMYFFFVVLS